MEIGVLPKGTKRGGPPLFKSLFCFVVVKEMRVNVRKCNIFKTTSPLQQKAGENPGNDKNCSCPAGSLETLTQDSNNP